MKQVTDAREQLAALVRAQVADSTAWELAELHLLAEAFRQRLHDVAVTVTPDVAVALMATATLLGEHAPEWGGNVRCALAEVARLGLALLEEGGSAAAAEEHAGDR